MRREKERNIEREREKERENDQMPFLKGNIHIKMKRL